MGEVAATWVALGLVGVLAALHLASPHLRRLPFVPEPALASFAGGLAVAYVFVHLLPELAEHQEAFRRRAEETGLLAGLERHT